MDSTWWYLIAFGSFVVLSVSLWVLKFFFPNLRSCYVRHVKLPLLFQRRRCWDSVSRLDAGLVFLFFMANLAIILIPFASLDWKQIERRTAFAAAINMTPLCLGGRMGTIIQSLNIHRSSYLLFHHWVGRIAIIEGLFHAGIKIFLQPATGKRAVSGWITAVLLLSALLLSISFMRMFFSKWFLFTHRILILGGLGVLFWHVLCVGKLRTQIVVGIALGIWLLPSVHRTYKYLRRPTAARVDAIVGDSSVMSVDVTLGKPMRVPPGSYFNIFFPGIHHGYPIIAYWHAPNQHEPSSKVSNISFLLSCEASYVNALASLKADEKIRLDGPYGQDLELESYENVIFAVEGTGIAAALPWALEIAERRQYDDKIRAMIKDLSLKQEVLREELKTAGPETYDRLFDDRKKVLEKIRLQSKRRLFRDAVHKIIIFWSLQRSSQMELIKNQLNILQKMDPDHKLFVVWCSYPSQLEGKAPFHQSSFWMCLPPLPDGKPFSSLIKAQIRDERQRLQGRLVVITCGTPFFTNKIREAVIDVTDDKPIHFQETEYRPRPSRFPNIQGHDIRGNVQKLRRRRSSQDIELRSLTRVSDGSSYSVVSL